MYLCNISFIISLQFSIESFDICTYMSNLNKKIIGNAMISAVMIIFNLLKECQSFTIYIYLKNNNNLGRGYKINI